MINKKIALFLNDYTEKKSGGVVAVLAIIKNFTQKNVVIITSEMGQQFCRQEKMKTGYLITTRERKINNVFFLYLKRLIKGLFILPKIKNQDIFLASSDFFPNTIPIWIIKRLIPEKIWVQHVFHLIPQDRKISYWLQALSLKLIKSRADLVVVDNSLLKKALVKRGFEIKKIVVNYLGVDRRYLKKMAIKKIKYQGVFLGRLHPSKGIFDLVTIWRYVTDQKPRAKLVIIGHGRKEMTQRLKKEINQKKLAKNIILTGYLEDDQVLETVRRSAVFVFPSHEEGFGLALLEAQACQKPVVAWNLPIFKEIFERGMIRVPFLKNHLFAAQVVSLLDDRKYYCEIAQQAKNNARKYSWQKTAQREWRAIEKLLID